MALFPFEINFSSRSFWLFFAVEILDVGCLPREKELRADPNIDISFVGGTSLEALSPSCEIALLLSTTHAGGPAQPSSRGADVRLEHGQRTFASAGSRSVPLKGGEKRREGERNKGTKGPQSVPLVLKKSAQSKRRGSFAMGALLTASSTKRVKVEAVVILASPPAMSILIDVETVDGVPSVGATTLAAPALVALETELRGGLARRRLL
ncbi:hypothetical protein AMTR_s00014p00254880 [Amborella trichopoda]|uniref:Uncharacterized protein n=1 Tax=Amborella trichopoda TaxID=13333 RepID=W1PN61_AMBTC|nr:hypothetical protein AMTR_s00014p00254880 [Amborella trichopoda]